MTSRRVEDVHQELLAKLLNDSGLECVRTPPESSESSISSGISEAPSPPEEEEIISPEIVIEEETKPPPEEEVHEELPEIFPSPSLRHALPDKVRTIEKQNRINVLPEEFKKYVDPLAIPKIAYTAQQKYIDILAHIVGCKKYKSSLAEFWFLDTLANLLRRAQEDEMDRPTQAILILWFCEWMKEMQYFDAADRNRMMRRFQDNMLAAGRALAEEDHLPTPTDAGVFYKAKDDIDITDVSATLSQSSKHIVSFEGAIYECCLRDLTKIIHYIFDLFSTDYQYNLIRSVFTFTPGYTLIDAPYQIQNPKRIYAPLKAKLKKGEKSPKKEKPIAKKKKDIETEDYLALMELIAREEKELEEQEERDKEQWNRKSHILPLGFAATDQFFNKYWPPPPVEPEPEVVPELKAKVKPKAKK